MSRAAGMDDQATDVLWVLSHALAEVLLGAADPATPLGTRLSLQAEGDVLAVLCDELEDALEALEAVLEGPVLLTARTRAA